MARVRSSVESSYFRPFLPIRVVNSNKKLEGPFFCSAAAAAVLLLLFLVFVQGLEASTVIRSRSAQGFRGAVASDEGRCSAMGTRCLQRGGNAADAAVTTALCLGVLNPMASGIGGGGFLLLRLTNGTAKAFDMREVAPAASSENMYADNSDSQFAGGLSVAVPSEIAGLHVVWQQHGRLPWKSLFQPAIRLADHGFIVHPYLAHSINSSSTAILADPGLRDVFAPNGTLLQPGDICYRKTLAKTLRLISNQGPDAFYRGPIAKTLVADVQAAGGILTMADLDSYRVKIRAPVVQDVLGLTILGMPPPSSGAATMILVLNILAAYDDPWSAVKGPLGSHRTIEAFKHAFALRMGLGDPDFVNVTDVLAHMLDPAFAARLQKLISDNRTFPPTFYGGRWSQLEDHGTSHFNIVDEERNVVAMTTTINYGFGAKFLSPSTGIVLNNEMGDFSIPTSDPGESPPAVANFIRPFKRPLSSMSPTIVMQDGQFVGALGGSGGVKIVTTTIQVFLNRFWKGYSAVQSIVTPRLHHQLMPDIVDYEDWTTAVGDHIEESESLVEFLVSKGHNATGTMGAMAQLIVEGDEVIEMWTHTAQAKQFGSHTRDIGKLTAVSDGRKDGYPAAF